MKLIVLKQVHSDLGAARVLPRAQFTLEELAGGKDHVLVSLSRRAGGCVYALRNLERHDGHAPMWMLDGAAPSECSDPDATLQGYVDRIVADIKAAGLDVVVETVEEFFAVPTPDDEGDDGEQTEPDDEGDDGEQTEPDDEGDGWKKYGVN